MAGEVGFGEEAEAGDAAGAGELVPEGFGDGVEGHAVDQVLEKGTEEREIVEALRLAPKRLNDPFTA